MYVVVALYDVWDCLTMCCWRYENAVLDAMLN